MLVLNVHNTRAILTGAPGIPSFPGGPCQIQNHYIHLHMPSTAMCEVTETRLEKIYAKKAECLGVRIMLSSVGTASVPRKFERNFVTTRFGVRTELGH